MILDRHKHQLAFHITVTGTVTSGKNITIQTTSLTGKLPNDVFADFVLKEDQKEILSCPTGHEPIACSFHENTGKITATMPGNCCASCPNRETCKARENKKKFSDDR